MRNLHAAHLAFHAVWVTLSALSGCGPVAADPGLALVVTETSVTPDEVPPAPAPATVVETPKAEPPREPVEAPCPCGCGKVGCKCGRSAPVAEAAPAPKEAEAVAESKRADLIVTVADKGCPPCVAFEVGGNVPFRDANNRRVQRYVKPSLPNLVAKGWEEGRNYEIRRVPFGAEVTPSFDYRGDRWVGYSGPVPFMARLRQAMERGAPVVAASEALPTAASGGGGPPYIKVHAGRRPLPGGAFESDTGSGTIVGRHDGNFYSVVTNRHVVERGGPYVVEIDGRRIAAALRGYDNTADLAIVEFKHAGDLPVVPLSAAPPAMGAAVVSHGYPNGGPSVRERIGTVVPAYPDGSPHHAPAMLLGGSLFENGESGGGITERGELVAVLYGNGDTRDAKPTANSVGLACTHGQLLAFLGKFGIKPEAPRTVDAGGRPTGPGNEYSPVSWSTEGSPARSYRLAMTGV